MTQEEYDECYAAMRRLAKENDVLKLKLAAYESRVSAAQWWIAHHNEKEAWLALFDLHSAPLETYPPPTDKERA